MLKRPVYEIHEEGELIERIEERSLAGVVTREEVHALLDCTGFDVVGEMSDFTGVQFRDGDPILTVEASKRG